LRGCGRSTDGADHDGKTARQTRPRPAAEPPPIAPKRISAKVRAAIGYMVSGDCKTQTEVAEKGRTSAPIACMRLEQIGWKGINP
jgi:hypothetical protein